MAAIATVERLLANDGEVYRTVDNLGQHMQKGLGDIVGKLGMEAVVARQGSAFCLYSMDHHPKDWHDLASHHRFTVDEQMRRAMIDHDVYVFPLATKQWSISAAHTPDEIDTTLQKMERVLTSPDLIASV